jgi:DNA-binding transcriptional ArsR family regulator
MAAATRGDPFAALGDPHRRTILELIADAPLSVQEVADRLPISRPAVSRHLRLLAESGLVTGERDGVRHVFRLSDEGLGTAEDLLRRIWGERAARFRLYAENTDEGDG